MDCALAEPGPRSLHSPQELRVGDGWWTAPLSGMQLRVGGRAGEGGGGNVTTQPKPQCCQPTQNQSGLSTPSPDPGWPCGSVF